MSFLDMVKLRLGVYYSSVEKDSEIQGMIDAATLYFKGAGWDVRFGPKALAVEAVALFCKMAQSTDPAQLSNHPVLISFIAQGRAASADV